MKLRYLSAAMLAVVSVRADMAPETRSKFEQYMLLQSKFGRSEVVTLSPLDELARHKEFVDWDIERTENYSASWVNFFFRTTKRRIAEVESLREQIEYIRELYSQEEYAEVQNDANEFIKSREARVAALEKEVLKK